MFSIFKTLLSTAPRSLIGLALTLFLATTGIVVINELVANIGGIVSKEARPYLGADISISARAGFTGSLEELVRPYLEWEVGIKTATKITFNTTIFDASGKSVLVKLVAVDDAYPMYSTFVTSSILSQTNTGSRRAGSWATEIIAATPNLIERLGSTITLDTLKLQIWERIDSTSELGFGIGDEGYLLIVSRSILAKTTLLDRGARLERSFLITTSGDTQTIELSKKLEALKGISAGSAIKVENYIKNASRTNEVIGELGRYSLMIIVVSILLGAITIYAGLREYFLGLEASLRVMHLLGLAKTRQIILVATVFVWIILIAIIASIGVSVLVLRILATLPETASFVFLIEPAVQSLLIIGIAALTLLIPEFLVLGGIKQTYWRIGVSLIGAIAVVSLVLESLLLGAWVVAGGVVMIYSIVWLLELGYRGYHALTRKGDLRTQRFAIFDWIRSLARPGMPAASITLTLIGSVGVLLLFLTLSFLFQSKLQVSDTVATNLFAVNILETDRVRVTELYGDETLYPVIQARIIRVNSQSLAEHLGTGSPSGEFTREYAVTTHPLKTTRILRGTPVAAGEVSVLQDFADRLKVDIGDTIEFAVAGRNFTLRVSNIREGTRTRIEPFFYFQVMPDAFDRAPKTYFLWLKAESVDAEKKRISEATGSHVVFIDTAAIVAQVSAISTKILSVLSLFLGFVTVFAILAILTLFGRMKPLFERKKYLYQLLGMNSWDIRTTQVLPVATVLLTAALGALALGLGGVAYVLSLSSLLSWELSPMLMALGDIGILLVSLGVYLRMTLLRK